MNNDKDCRVRHLTWVEVLTSRLVEPGEELNICYTGIFLSTLERQAVFKKRHFICRCARCMDPSELGSFLTGIRCSKCDETMADITNFCVKCKTKLEIGRTVMKKAEDQVSELEKSANCANMREAEA